MRGLLRSKDCSTVDQQACRAARHHPRIAEFSQNLGHQMTDPGKVPLSSRKRDQVSTINPFATRPGGADLPTTSNAVKRNHLSISMGCSTLFCTAAISYSICIRMSGSHSCKFDCEKAWLSSLRRCPWATRSRKPKIPKGGMVMDS
jgi:hypothetical protein